VLNQGPLPLGYLPDEQRFRFQAAGVPVCQPEFLSAGVPLPLLPFTLPVAGDFKFGYAQQANLTIEHQISSDYKLSVAYTYTHGLKLHRPEMSTRRPGAAFRELPERPGRRAPGHEPDFGVGPTGNIPATSARAACRQRHTRRGARRRGPPERVPGVTLGPGGPARSELRPFSISSVHPAQSSFAGLVPGGYSTQVALAQAAAIRQALRVQRSLERCHAAGVVRQLHYHGLTLGFSKRFSSHVEFVSSYTWSHAIDDSTDLQTLLSPQNNRRPDLERSSSTFDQRHRWVTSAVIESPFRRTSPGWHRKLLADFVFSPSSSSLRAAVHGPHRLGFQPGFRLEHRPAVGRAGGVSSPFIESSPFTAPTACDNP